MSSLALPALRLSFSLYSFFILGLPDSALSLQNEATDCTWHFAENESDDGSTSTSSLYITLNCFFLRDELDNWVKFFLFYLHAQNDYSICDFQNIFVTLCIYNTRKKEEVKSTGLRERGKGM